MIWRWDQGRLGYFQFDTIVAVSTALTALEGSETSKKAGDVLRPPLEEATGLDFLPKDYSVWRNYGRVFELQLLATQKDGHLLCTDICRSLAQGLNTISCDEYLATLAKRFYYPSPVFQGYVPNGPQNFPFCAILKYLLARAARRAPFATISEVFSEVIGNDCDGTEPVDRYMRLRPTSRQPNGDEGRQVREMVIFFSQFTFLKWQSPTLYLDLADFNEDSLRKIESIATPVRARRHSDRATELLSLGKITPQKLELQIPEKRFDVEDQEFIEGKKVRLTHLRSERSSVLRAIFFRAKNPPYVCDMCELNVTIRYPWVDNLLEVHHLLPLSSPLHIELGRTSIRDLVGICPNCHRATHRFYRAWLDNRSASDFNSRDEARQVYEDAKEALVVQ